MHFGDHWHFLQTLFQLVIICSIVSLRWFYPSSLPAKSHTNYILVLKKEKKTFEMHNSPHSIPHGIKLLHFAYQGFVSLCLSQQQFIISYQSSHCLENTDWRKEITVKLKAAPHWTLLELSPVTLLIYTLCDLLWPCFPLSHCFQSH